MARGECVCPCPTASFAGTRVRENVGKWGWLGEAVSLWGHGAGPSNVASVPPPPPQSSPVESEEEEPEEQDWEEDSGEGPPAPSSPWKTGYVFSPLTPQSACSPPPKR